MKRSITVTIAMVVVLTGLLIFFLIFSMDSLITMAVEKFGSEALQAEVTLQKTDISARTGKGTLRGLKVGNPKGFETESAFELGEISVAVDVKTIPGDTVVIKEIVIGAPQITYEMGAGGSNLDALQRNASAATGGGGKGSDSKEPAAPGGKGKKMVIEKLVIQNGKINVSAVGLKGQKMTVDLPRVQLTNIGKDKGGATPAEVAKKLINAINAAAGGAVKGLDLGKIVGDVEGVAKGAKEALEKGATDMVGEKAGELGNAMKGLLGK